MYTSLITLAMAGSLAGADVATPAWHNDYAKAKAVAASESKPLAVFLVKGERPDQLVGEPLGQAVNKQLGQEYVCLKVDTSTPKGQALARNLEVSNGTGLVISSRGGDLQAFAHDGTISRDDLSARLVRYADPAHVVVRTEQVASATSAGTIIPASATGLSYAPGQVVPAGATAPAPGYSPFVAPAWQSSGYCPSCQRR